MRTVVRALLIAALLSVALATPTLGAKPIREVIDVDDPALEAEYAELLTEACGVPIAVDFEGRLTVHVFFDRHGEFKREIDKYWIRDRFTNLETGATVLLRDVGPDIVWVDRRTGELWVAITGRSLTGSGVIGRTLINIDTNEVVKVAGKSVGTIEEQVCGAIG